MIPSLGQNQSVSPPDYSKTVRVKFTKFVNEVKPCQRRDIFHYRADLEDVSYVFMEDQAIHVLIFRLVPVLVE